MDWLTQYKYILASKSPRRQKLLKQMGLSFEIRLREVDESYPSNLTPFEIPVYLARHKAQVFVNDLKDNELLITADTIVCLDNEILGKPNSSEEARAMLNRLSARQHEVITGVCLTSIKKQCHFYALTQVEFKTLSSKEIDYYIYNYQPFDKAGAYGIQEWIGSIGITGIEGSFYNVMGLPVQKLYEEIQKF